MALAGTGALIAMLIIAAITARLKRDFAREMRESLRVTPPVSLLAQHGQQSVAITFELLRAYAGDLRQRVEILRPRGGDGG